MRVSITRFSESSRFCHESQSRHAVVLSTIKHLALFKPQPANSDFSPLASRARTIWCRPLVTRSLVAQSFAYETLARVCSTTAPAADVRTGQQTQGLDCCSASVRLSQHLLPTTSVEQKLAGPKKSQIGYGLPSSTTALSRVAGSLDLTLHTDQCPARLAPMQAGDLGQMSLSKAFSHMIRSFPHDGR